MRRHVFMVLLVVGCRASAAPVPPTGEPTTSPVEPVADAPLAAAPAECVPDPYVVDFSAAEHAALEHAMAEAVAVVAYDCERVRLLDCHAEGAYAFSAFPRVEREAGGIDDSVAPDKSATSLEIAYVGTLSASTSDARVPLTGSECGDATHLVRTAWIGAFVLEDRDASARSVDASAPGATLRASRSHSHASTRSAGEIETCAPATGSAPPASCRAPIRLELVALARG